MLSLQLPIYPYLTLSHDRFEMKEHFLSSPFFCRIEMLAIPDHTLIIYASTSLSRKILYPMRNRYYLPFSVIIFFIFSLNLISFKESPCYIHRISLPSGMLQWIKPGSREFGRIRIYKGYHKQGKQ